jgi:hypothetical protein
MQFSLAQRVYLRPSKIGPCLLTVAAVVGLSAACSQAGIIFTQNFESSTAAIEYASGDNDPDGPAFTQNVQEQKSHFVQVVDTNTTPNLSPSGLPQVFEGNNSLKIDSNVSASPPPAR